MKNSRKQLFLSCLLSTLYCLLLTGCHSLPPSTPLDQLNAQQTQGHAVFQTHCAQCHYDRTDDSLHGRTLMPAQPNIDPQDLADILAYLHTL